MRLLLLLGLFLAALARSTRSLLLFGLFLAALARSTRSLLLFGLFLAALARSTRSSLLLDSLASLNRSILCLGDSHTTGYSMELYTRSITRYAPYGLYMQASLDGMAMAVRVRVAAFDNDTTTSLFQRLPFELFGDLVLAQQQGQQQSVGLVVVLAGKNDIRYVPRRTAVQTLSHLISLHETVHAAGANTLSVAIPRCSFFQALKLSAQEREVNEQRRIFINAGLKAFVERQTRSDGSSRVFHLDLQSEWDKAEGAEQSKFWAADLCHFSRLGYQSMAALVLKAVQTHRWRPIGLVGLEQQRLEQAQLPLCQDNGHRLGNWFLDSAAPASNKSFVCCGGGSPLNKTRGHLDVDDVKLGYCSLNHTLPLPVQRGLQGLNAACGDDCCACDREAGTRYSLSLRERWEWRPTACRLVDWSAEGFCRVLGPTRRLLLVGDSTMQQAFSTLTSMITAGGGACAPQVLFGISSHLMTSPPPFRSKATEFIEELRPDIAVLSVGAHLHDMGDMHVILDLLQAGLADLKARLGSLPVILWRSQFPGHILCERHAVPLPFMFREAPEDLHKHDRHHWRLFRKFDELTRNRSVALGWEFLDVSPLYYRPDGHVLRGRWAGGKRKPVDCLHSCMPGPLNLFSRLLLHHLTLLSTTAD